MNTRRKDHWGPLRATFGTLFSTFPVTWVSSSPRHNCACLPQDYKDTFIVLWAIVPELKFLTPFWKWYLKPLLYNSGNLFLCFLLCLSFSTVAEARFELKGILACPSPAFQFIPWLFPVLTHRLRLTFYYLFPTESVWLFRKYLYFSKYTHLNFR